jgi:hypothetical protein
MTPTLGAITIGTALALGVVVGTSLAFEGRLTLAALAGVACMAWEERQR